MRALRIRYVTGAVSAWVLLACSSAPSGETTATSEESALTIPLPCGHSGQSCCHIAGTTSCGTGLDCNSAGTCVPCGGSGDPACTSGTACASGTMEEVGGVCYACSEIETNVGVTTQVVQDPATDYLAVVDFATVPGAAGVLVTLQGLTTPTLQEHTVYSTTGTTTFSGLQVGSSYSVSVAPFGTNGAYCNAATSQLTVAKQCVTDTSPTLYPANGQGQASVELCNDGTWTYTGSVSDTGAFPEGYAMIINIAWQDTTGNYPLSFLQTGGLAGGISFQGSKSQSFTQQGTSSVLALNWLPISQAGYKSDLSVKTDVGDAIADVLGWSTAALGAAISGYCCAAGTVSVNAGTLRCDCEVGSGTPSQ